MSRQFLTGISLPSNYSTDLGSGVITNIVGTGNISVQLSANLTANASGTYIFYSGGVVVNNSGASPYSTVVGQLGTNQLVVLNNQFVLEVGQTVTGTGIQVGTTVTDVVNSSNGATLTLSQSLTANTSGNYTFLRTIGTATGVTGNSGQNVITFSNPGFIPTVDYLVSGAGIALRSSISSVTNPGPWTVSIRLTTAGVANPLPAPNQSLTAAGFNNSNPQGVTTVTASPIGSGATSVLVTSVGSTVINSVTYTTLTYKVTGGVGPVFGYNGKLSGIYTLSSAPLYIQSSKKFVGGSYSLVGAADFIGVPTIGALENNGTNLFFTIDSNVKKTILFSDTNGYSGTLTKALTFSPRMFSNLSGSVTANDNISYFNNSAWTVKLREGASWGNYGDENIIWDSGTPSNTGGVSPYSAKNSKLALLSSSSILKITSILINRKDPFNVVNGWITYMFEGYTSISASSSIKVYNTGYTYSGQVVYDLPNGVIPGDYSNYKNWGYSSNQNVDYFKGYFSYQKSNSELQSPTYADYEPSNAYAVVTSNLGTNPPVFRAITGEDVNLSVSRKYDGVTSNLPNGFVGLTSDNTLGVLSYPPGSNAYVQSLFMRGDGIWAAPPANGWVGNINGNTSVLTAEDPSPTSSKRTLTIRPTYTTSYNGDFNLSATGNGTLSLSGGLLGGALTIYGGESSVNAVAGTTSIAGVTNQGSGNNSQGGPLFLDAGSGGANAAAGVLNLGTLTANTGEINIGNISSTVNLNYSTLTLPLISNVTAGTAVKVLIVNASNNLGKLAIASSPSTQFLRGDGNWATPSGGGGATSAATTSALGGVKLASATAAGTINTVTSATNRTYGLQLDSSNVAAINVPWTDTDTTYSFATGDSNGTFKVTPSAGTAQNVSIYGLGSAAYTSSGDYATASHNHSIDSLSNVTISSKLTNDLLQWNGTAWVNKTISGAGIASTTYVDTAIASLVDSAPATLNTLNELATALNNDASFSTTITNALGNKQPLDADLTAIAALTGTGILKRTGTDTWTTITDDSSNWNTAYTDRMNWDGGSTGLTASTGRTSLGATTVGSNLFTLTNPSAITFIRLNADNTVSALDASTFRTAIGAGTSSTTGTVTSITAGTTGLTGGTISTSGTIDIDTSKVPLLASANTFTVGPQTVQTGGAANKSLVMQGAASQTADLLQTQTSSSVINSGINPVGQSYFGTTTTLKGNIFYTLTTASGSGTAVTYTSSSSLATQPFQVGSSVTIGSGFTPSGYSSVTGVITAVGGSSGAWTFTIAGATTGTSSGTASASLSAAISAVAATPGITPLIVQGALNQGSGSNAMEIQSSTGGLLTRFAGNGRLNVGTTLLVGAATGDNGANQLEVRSTATTQIGAVIRGYGTGGSYTQTGDLTQWQSWNGSASTVLAKVDANGNIFTGNMAKATSSVGTLHLSNATAPTATATGGGVLYVDTGALKYMGTSGTAATVVNADGTLPSGGGGTTTNGLTIGTTGLTATSGTSPFNGAGAVTIDIDTSKVPTLSANNTLTGSLTLRQGSTGANTGPLYFHPTGTSVLSTPVSGAREYDATVFYQTSNTNPGRALDTQNYYYLHNSSYSLDFSGSAAAQSILGGTTTGITLAAGTTYEFELYVALQHQYISNTTMALSHGWTSTTVTLSPTVAYVQYLDYSNNTTGFTTAATKSSVRTTTTTVSVSAAVTTGSRYSLYTGKGTIRVTGTGTVKVYPHIVSSAIGDNAVTIQAGSYLKLTPIGNGTVTTVGTWA